MPLYDWLIISRQLAVPMMTRLLLKLPNVVFRVPGLMRLLWRFGIESYEVHTTYLLTCFITAHEQAEEEMHWMFGQRKARLHNEEIKVRAFANLPLDAPVQVVNESQTAVREAQHYLQELAQQSRCLACAGFALACIGRGYAQRLVRAGCDLHCCTNVRASGGVAAATPHRAASPSDARAWHI
eukprot:2638942-Prymnesium_polylepis.3